jgi:UDP-N-acetylglucosamine--N-acetylmuramyl-(pentapeptide) pyrophosphoryl-undecaprenol N-acetylglucosamine transferase
MGEILIICGGTGGHLTPGIAVAERFVQHGSLPRLVISAKQVDKHFCRKYPDLPFLVAPGVAFSWHPAKFIRFIFQLFHSLWFSCHYISKNKPDAVVAFGGFLSVAFILAAWIYQVPLYLHESNRIPGRTIRIFSRMATRVYLPEGVRLLGLKPGLVRHLGMPLRREIRHIPKEVVREQYGLNRHDKVLVVIGGSQGAKSLNEWVVRNGPSLAGDGIHTICITGPGKGVEKVDTYSSDNGDPITVRWIPFSEQMADLYSLADLVICRSGAGTIAELITCLCPSIQIPYPHSADQHQIANARDLERRGGCIMIFEQDKIKGLCREVCDLIFNDWLLSQMRENLRALARSDPAREMVLQIESDIHSRIDSENLGTEVNA